MSDTKDENPLAHLVDDMVGMVAAGQALGLKVLQAEMEALSQVLPGATHAQSEAERVATEAKIEADLDNMPI